MGNGRRVTRELAVLRAVYEQAGADVIARVEGREIAARAASRDRALQRLRDALAQVEPDGLVIE